MPTVRTPVPGFAGMSAGVEFVDGVGETDDPRALSYFRRAGYHIDEQSEPEPSWGPADEGVDSFHVGAGWYQMPDGTKVRGRDNAERLMKADG